MSWGHSREMATSGLASTQSNSQSALDSIVSSAAMDDLHVTQGLVQDPFLCVCVPYIAAGSWEKDRSPSIGCPLVCGVVLNPSDPLVSVLFSIRPLSRRTGNTASMY